jgi:quinolinate synthase
MRKQCPDKEYLTVASDKGCNCSDCSYMKLNTLEKLYKCLRDESPEITMSDELIEKAKKPIIRMLDMSRELGIIK